MRTLLTGGSACGKSTYGEALAVSWGGPLYYIATMEPMDKECDHRIGRHRRLRAEKGFMTIERFTDLAGLFLPDFGTVLLECLCNLTANEMFSPRGAGEKAVEAVLDGVDRLEQQCRELIVVTNDVGSGGGAYEPLTTAYVENLGKINCALAARFDCVVELVCGIPLLRKGAQR